MNGAQFRALASGTGDAAAVGRLIEGQRSLVRGLLGAVYQAATARPPSPRRARRLLARPGTCWPPSTVSSPWRPGRRPEPPVPAGLGRALPGAAEPAGPTPAASPGGTRPIRDREGSDRDLAADLGHLGAVAAAGATRAGMGAAVTVPVVNAAIHLPTLGRLLLGPDGGRGRAEGEP